MKRQIIVGHGDVKKIATALGCTVQSVGNALHFRKDTPLAKKIRFYAMKEYGGVEIGGKPSEKAC